MLTHGCLRALRALRGFALLWLLRKEKQGQVLGEAAAPFLFRGSGV